MDEGEEISRMNDFAKPEQPSVSDCCNSGCNPCVFDLYEIRLSEWLNKDKLDTKSNTEVRYDLLSETKFKPFILLEKRNMNRNVYFLKFQPYILKISSENCQVLEQSIPGILYYRPGQHVVIKASENNFNKLLPENDLVSIVDEETERSSKDLSPKMLSLDDCNSYTAEKGGDNCSTSKSSGQQHSITRAYTLISLSSESVNCAFNIIVKLYKNGVMSNYFSELQMGDIAYFRGPYGNFQYVPNSYRSILMICMGTGIAPMYSIAKHILSNESDETIIKLLYGSRHVDDIILREELCRMASYWNFSSTFFVTNGELNFAQKFGEHFVSNRISESDIVKNFSYKKDQLCLICGTGEFNNDVLTIVLKHGAENNNIHVF